MPPPPAAPIFDFTPPSYTPLPTPTSIRLLKIIGRRSPSHLHPSNPTDPTNPTPSHKRTAHNSPHPPPSLSGHPLIQCALVTHDLSDPDLPPYAALSYTWDNPEPDWYTRPSDASRDAYGPGASWPVCVDGRLFLVRKNLFEALQQFHPDNPTADGRRPSGDSVHDDEDNGNVDADVDALRERADEALIDAATEGDVGRVRRLLRRGVASVGARDGWGETALHYAAELGRWECVVELVRAGAQVGLFDLKGRTPLQCSMQYGRRGRGFRKIWRFLGDEAWRREVLAKGEGVLEGEDGEDEDESGSDDEEEDDDNDDENDDDDDENDEEDDEDEDEESCSDDEDDSETDSDEESSADGDAELETGERMLWIDALCINQDDLEERAAQVKIMPQVYDRADEVLVWLGTGLDRAWRLQRAISRVNKADDDLDELARKWRNSLEHLLRHGMGPGENGLPEDCIMAPGEVEELSHWLTRSYFTRTWVVQELSLAKRVRMFSGPYEFCWPDVLKFLALLARVGYFDHSTFWRIDDGKRSEDAIGGDSTEAWKLAAIRLRTRDDPSEWALLDPIFANDTCAASAPSGRAIRRNGLLSLPLILSLCWTFQSKDPRDKIFALLTIAKPLPEPDRIPIDYTVPVARLFARVAHLFLRGSGDDAMYIDDSDGGAAPETAHPGIEPLEGLSYVQIPNMGPRTRIPGLPSWVPEFSTPLTTTRLWRRGFRAATAVAPAHAPHPEDDGGVLALKARADWDEVVAVQDKWERDEKLTIDVPVWLEVLSGLLPDGGTYRPTGECGMQVLCRTLMADRLWDGGDEEARRRVRESFRDFLAWELANEVEDEGLGDVCHPHDHVWNLVTEARQRLDNLPPSSCAAATDLAAAAAVAGAETGEAEGTSGEGAADDGGRFFMPSVEEINDCGKRLAEISAEGGGWCDYHGPDCVTYDDGSTFRSAFLRVYRKRALFRTEKGYLGLGPEDTKPGDKVSLVAGARVPYVMRRVKAKKRRGGRDGKEIGEEGRTKNDGRYKLLGEAYVHGIMYGEVSDSGDDGELERFETVELV